MAYGLLPEDTRRYYGLLSLPNMFVNLLNCTIRLTMLYETVWPPKGKLQKYLIVILALLHEHFLMSCSGRPGGWCRTRTC